jgi:ribosome-associated protein
MSTVSPGDRFYQMPRRTAPTPAEVTQSGIEFARQAAHIADDNRAEDVLVLDLRGLTSIADFFVIATGSSDRQLRAIADHIEEHARSTGQRPFGVSGYEHASWLLLDYVDVVVHLFDVERRRYYDLELLWGDAPRVDWGD